MGCQVHEHLKEPGVNPSTPTQSGLNFFTPYQIQSLANFSNSFHDVQFKTYWLI
jgi:hypothetical protein